MRENQERILGTESLTVIKEKDLLTEIKSLLAIGHVVDLMKTEARITADLTRKERVRKKIPHQMNLMMIR